MNPVIRNMEETDLKEVVQLHIISFPEFFLTSLGKSFLFELYHNFLHFDSSICKVIQKDGYIQGFVVGSLNPEALFRNLLILKGYKFLFLAIGALIKNPVFVSGKLMYALKYRGERPEKLTNAALLSSVGINPAFAKGGLGSMLVKAFCEEAFLKNADVVYLTTDKIKNDPVNEFYIKNGFQLEGSFEKSAGRIMNRYIKYRNEKSF